MDRAGVLPRVLMPSGGRALATRRMTISSSPGPGARASHTVKDRPDQVAVRRPLAGRPALCEVGRRQLCPRRRHELVVITLGDCAVRPGMLHPKGGGCPEHKRHVPPIALVACVRRRAEHPFSELRDGLLRRSPRQRKARQPAVVGRHSPRVAELLEHREAGGGALRRPLLRGPLVGNRAPVRHPPRGPGALRKLLQARLAGAFDATALLQRYPLTLTRLDDWIRANCAPSSVGSAGVQARLPEKV